MKKNILKDFRQNTKYSISCCIYSNTSKFHENWRQKSSAGVAGLTGYIGHPDQV